MSDFAVPNSPSKACIVSRARCASARLSLSALVSSTSSLTSPVITRGYFVGGTLEAGNAWARRSDMRLSALRTGMSLFIGADTGLGPLFLGVTYAPQGSAGLALFIGRP